MALQLDSFVNWALIGTIAPQVPGPLPAGSPAYPASYISVVPGDSLSSNAIFVCDDNSIIALAKPAGIAAQQGLADFFPLVIDASGAKTLYAAPAPLWGGRQDLTNVFGVGNLQITDVAGARPGGTAFILRPRFVNTKLNNPVPIVLPDTTAALVGPCGESYQKGYFDAVQGLAAYGFYGGQGQSGGSISAKVYSVDRLGNQTLLTQGPVGAWNSSGRDDFDHTGLNGGGAVSGVMSNGILAVCNLNTAYSVSIAVSVGASQACAGPNTGIRVDQRPNGTATYPYFIDINVGNDLLVDTNIPNLVSVQSTGIQFFYPGGFQAFISAATAPNGTNHYSQWCVAVTRKYMFAVSNAPGSGGPIAIYRSNTPTPLLALPPTVSRHTRFAANNARPISLTGRYKA